MTFSLGVFPLVCLLALQTEAFQTPSARRSFVSRSSGLCHATVAPRTSSVLEERVLESMSKSIDASREWSDMLGLTQDEAAFYALFRAIRESVPLGLKGQPFVLREEDIVKAFGQTFAGFFTKNDLKKAVQDDFLDADRGSTDNRKGWTISSVSEPRGNSFDDAKMLFEEVEEALKQGTVIFNSAGAHIPKLAGANLAVADATSLPCAVNIYITAPNKKTSAPPHTDKQDVVVVQTSGRKHWKVYSPPDPSVKPMADMFARGKHMDNLPLYALESEFGCELLLDTTLNVGDCLFLPAAFPHTTDTATGETTETSIHLTFGIDTHIWDLDYLSARRFALRRAGVTDTALGQVKDEDNRYVGACNEVSPEVRMDLFDALPFGLLDDNERGEALLVKISAELERISRAVDSETASAVDPSIWKETAARVRQEGMELLEIHRDMFLSAIEEGRIREAEDAMTAHLEGPKKMSAERIARLSCFRVKDYFDKINESMTTMLDWSHGGKKASGTHVALPENWAFSLPVKVGDQVEADLGGAFFPATVMRVVGDKYDVAFFDGDQESGLERSMLKLVTPPAAKEQEEEDTSKMTAKQLKRWKKQQEKKNKQT